MDTLNHAAQGFIVHYLIGSLFGPTMAIIFGIIGALFGAAPDLLDVIKQGLYESTHRGKLNRICKWVPAWGLHTWLDSLCHDIGERWYCGVWYDYFLPWKWKEMMWLEVATWAIVITLLILIF
jgi:hypothetical protein